MYSQVLTNYLGYDSTIILNLIINSINTSITESGASLTSNSIGALYQWVNCNGYIMIPGATNQTYNATGNGNYAVIVTLGSCIDTSSCVSLTTVGLNNNGDENNIIISPNPVTSSVNITFSEEQKNTSLKITDVTGRMVNAQRLMVNGKSATLDMSGYAKGIYFVEIKTEKEIVNRKIVVQ